MPGKDEYLDSVTQEIAFKAARKYLRRELEMHIEDKTHELAAAGAADAEQLAVASMGDAKETGRALNAVHRPRTEWGVIACALLLNIIGFIIIIVTSANDIAFISGWYLEIQLKVFILSFIVLIIAYFFNYVLLVRLRFVSFAAGLVLCGVSFFSHIYHAADFWIDNLYSFFTLTPLLFLLSMLGFMETNKSNGVKGLFRTVMICAISTAALDLSFHSLTAFILPVIYLIMLSIALPQSNRKAALRHILIAVGVLTATFILLGFIRMWIVEWRYGNIIDTQINWNIGFDISIDQNTNVVHNMLYNAPLIGPSPYYTQNQSWDLSGSGASFILTSVIAAYGWLAGIGVLMIFTALLALMFIHIRHITHTFGKMLITGIVAWLFFRLVIILLTNTGVIGTISGVLPFVSFSNSYYVCDSLLLGVFLSVWRRSTFMKDSIILKAAVK